MRLIGRAFAQPSGFNHPGAISIGKAASSVSL
jgi:hypothetical protein